MKKFRILLFALVTLFLSTSIRAEVGHWKQDAAGLPVYDYTGILPFKALDEDGNDSRMHVDPFFLLGNHRLTLFAHVSGTYQFITGERSWARVNAAPDRPDYGVAEASLAYPGGERQLVGMTSAAADPAVCKRTFGVGFAQYDFSFGKVSCSRILSVKPSENVKTGTRGFLLTLEVTNRGKAGRFHYREALPVNFVPVGQQGMHGDSAPYTYPVSAGYADATTAVAHVAAVPNGFQVVPGESERCLWDAYPPEVFMVSDGGATVRFEGGSLVAESEFRLRKGETRRIHIVIGLGDDKEAKDIAGELFASESENRFTSAWKKSLPDFSSEQDPVIQRELYWNAHFVEASATYNTYYDEALIPQGSVYAYHIGENAANRDHLQALLPTIYTNPALAKSCLRFVMKMSEADGQIKRENQGYGYCMPTIYMESDQQLYFFDAMAEYLRVTGDYAFLDEEVEIYPAELGVKVKVLDLLGRYFVYLRDIIGRGPTGLIKLHNSDWSDSFLHKYSPNKYSWSAESYLNSAMALAILPRFAEALATSHRPDSERLAKAVRKYDAELRTSYFKLIDGCPYSPRASLTPDMVLGRDTVCIEPQGYLLQSAAISAERKAEIYGNVRKAIIDPERIGARTRETPIWGGLPESEDGGIWFSLEYPLLLGVATFDVDEAWRLYRMFSFDNFTKHHPDYWVGQFTAPDELNSSMYREGLYAFWLGLQDYTGIFQGWCSHPHTWPLYCYYRLKEYEKVPKVRVVAEGGYLHRFFDTSPISPSGKYIALFKFPNEEKGPAPGDEGTVTVLELATGNEVFTAPSRGWEMQLGANVQWGTTDNELYYNDVDPSDWSDYAVKADIFTGKKERCPGTVFMVSPDGKKLLSYNLRKSRFAQVGYGVVVPDTEVSRNWGPVDDDGIFVTDLATGQCKMIASICDIYEKAVPSIRIDNPEQYEYYCFQVKWNAQGTRLLTTLQWTFPGEYRRRAVVTMKPDGSDIRVAITPDQWARGGHHINWMPDGEHLSMNLELDGRPGVEIIEVRYDGTDLREVYPVGSGHPSWNPVRPLIVSDAYSGEMPLQDGRTPIRLIDVQRQTESLVASLALPPIRDFEFRVDAHPVWDRTGRYLTFNSFKDGHRCVMVADIGNE